MAHSDARHSAALVALKQGQLFEALKLLGDETPDQARSWSHKDRDELRWKLVSQRDEGNIDIAFSGLKIAARIWPSEPIYLLELLVLRAHGSRIEIDELIRSAPPDVRHDPQIAIHLGFDAAQTGQLDEARAYLSHTAGTPPEILRPFAAIHSQALRLAVLDPAKTAYLKAQAQQGFDTLASTEASTLIDALGEMIVQSDGIGNLSSSIRSIVFQNVYGLPHVQNLTLEALKRNDHRLSLPGRVARLALLEAFRLPEASNLAESILADEASRSNAHFARLGATLAARTRNGALERSILSRFAPAQHTIASIDCARAAEVNLRRHVVKADRPLEVFIGLFGQMRDPDIVIPKLVASIQAAFTASSAGPFNLSFGLSSWSKTGHRALTLDDAAGFFGQASPPPLAALFHERYGANGHQLALTYPHLIAALLAYVASRSPRDLSSTELTTYLPKDSEFILEPESQIEDEIRKSLAQGGTQDAWRHINQFKMWSRIARLSAPIATFETKMGRAFDACLIIRCDLADVSGHIGDAIAQASSIYDLNTVYYDYDPHAEYIEGAGDRYIIASREAMAKIILGYDNYLRIHENDGPHLPLRERMSAHEGLQSLIYRQGLTPHPVWNLHYRIHRGAPPAATLIPALTADLQSCSDPDLRDVMQNALNGLEALQ